jgi:hypothetical protein
MVPGSKRYAPHPRPSGHTPSLQTSTSSPDAGHDGDECLVREPKAGPKGGEPVGSDQFIVDWQMPEREPDCYGEDITAIHPPAQSLTPGRP